MVEVADAGPEPSPPASTLNDAAEARVAATVADGPAQTPQEAELSLLRLDIPAGNDRLASPMRTTGPCQAGNRFCLEISSRLNRRAIVFTFFTIEGQIGVPNCNADLRFDREGSYSWFVGLEEDSEVVRMAFHLLATTSLQLATQIRDHIQRIPGVCAAGGSPQDWANQLTALVRSANRPMSYRTMQFEKSAAGLEVVAP